MNMSDNKEERMEGIVDNDAENKLDEEQEVNNKFLVPTLEDIKKTKEIPDLVGDDDSSEGSLH